MKKINWLDHIANLLVVILGISIAFYLESYKSAVDSSRQEKKYMESLIDDLDADIQTIDILLQNNEGIMKALISLSNASIGRESLGDSGLVNSVFAIQYNPPFAPRRTTYESLKSSGKMDLINDFELRRKTIALYEQYYHGMNEYDVALSDHIRDFVKPFYIEEIKIKGRYEMNDDFLDSDKFRNIIFSYRYLFIAKNDYYKKIKEEVSAVKLDLESHLNLIN